LLKEFTLYLHAVMPRVGTGYPLSCLVHSLLIFCCILLFPFSHSLYHFFCPSLPFLPESSHSVSRREVVGGDNENEKLIGVLDMGLVWLKTVFFMSAGRTLDVAVH